MKAGTKAALALLLLVLAGCASQAERQARQEAQRQAYAERLAAQCRAYGFSYGTPEFAQCMMQLDIANQQARQDRQIYYQQMMQSGMGMMNQPRPIPPSQIHCSPDGLGGVICR